MTCTKLRRGLPHASGLALIARRRARGTLRRTTSTQLERGKGNETNDPMRYNDQRCALRKTFIDVVRHEQLGESSQVVARRSCTRRVTLACGLQLVWGQLRTPRIIRAKCGA